MLWRAKTGGAGVGCRADQAAEEVGLSPAALTHLTGAVVQPAPRDRAEGGQNVVVEQPILSGSLLEARFSCRLGALCCYGRCGGLVGVTAGRRFVLLSFLFGDEAPRPE